MPDYIRLRSRAIRSACAWLEANMPHWRDSLREVENDAEPPSYPYKGHDIVKVLDWLTGNEKLDLIMLDTMTTRTMFEALSNRKSFAKLLANTERQTGASLEVEEWSDLLWGLALAYAARGDLVTTVLIFRTMIGVDLEHDLATETETYILSQQHFTGYFGKFGTEFFLSQTDDTQLAVKSELTVAVLKALIEAHACTNPNLYF
jgi:hypothetical protein